MHQLIYMTKCFSSKNNKYTVFLFPKLRNEVLDLSAHWGKIEKSKLLMNSHHIYIYLGGISYVRSRKKVMHDLVSVSEKIGPVVYNLH